jgi:4-hydroxybenzoate polyprenyltransferase
MRLAIRLLTALAVFLALAAAVYGWMSFYGSSLQRDAAGPALLLVCGVAFGYVSLVLRAAARRADQEAAAEEGVPAGRVAHGHVPPTIWPLGFAGAALLLVVGSVAAGRLLVPLGLALFVAAAAGWSADVRRSRHGG